MRTSSVFATLAALVMLQQVTTATAATSRLKVAFYNNTACANVETVVRLEVTNEFKKNPGIAAQLIRIFFHDCFADGQCDASLLLTNNKDPAVSVELNSLNNQGIRGLDFINYLKTRVVQGCAGEKDLVSCADIIALAARDAVYLTAPRRSPYKIPTGRLDGKISLQSNAETLPASRSRIADIVSRFQQAGFSAAETVILSGAHTLGQARCKFFDDRLYNWRTTKRPDPSLNTTLATFLRKTCTNSLPSKESRVFLDQGTPFVFDKDYFVMLTKQEGVMESDQKLLTDPLTKAFVQPLAAGSEANFANKFEAAMIKMGNLGATTVVGSKGEIRRVCSLLN